MGLTSSERRDLEDFAHDGWELRRAPMLRKGSVFSFSMRIEPQQFAIQSTEPDEPDVALTVFQLRPFLMENDRHHIGRVFNFCMQQLTDTALRDELRQWQGAWKQSLREGGFRLQVDEQHWNPAFTLRTYLHAHYGHSDRDKRDAIEALGMLRPLGRQQFLAIVFQ